MAGRSGLRFLLPRPVLRERAGVRVLGPSHAKSPHPNPLPEYRAREPEFRQAAITRSVCFATIAIIFLTLATITVAGPPDRIEIYPSQISLQSHRATRQLIVTGYFNGEARDLTSQATIVSADPKIVVLQGTRAVPIADGQTSVTVSIAGQSAQFPATVSNFAKADPVQFKFETEAVLTKQGCATGSCHGSPHGKGNFSLSLFGYDPTIDRISLMRDGFNRRVNVMDPAESLMLKKPLMQLSHVGGKRLQKTDAAYRILYDWIFEGADTSLPDVECRKIAVYPTTGRVLKAPYLKQQISVLAEYSDGTVRDMTSIATYSSSSASVAEADAAGLVTGNRAGRRRSVSAISTSWNRFSSPSSKTCPALPGPIRRRAILSIVSPMQNCGNCNICRRTSVPTKCSSEGSLST